ncbi:unconventional myosin-Ie isoform X1 [Frankliniella occidentalis]|uniref:Unconventional myosin-Ie isoform X1 n=1 Tax=Frankliniella occidentalis TaxID=133901 RepID=A0A9C6U1J8_FRAOC|nr:unconventional myosin-Ie isoform X1 [Frankliniella occidentalis]
MGFSEVEQRDIWNIVAAILHLGNVNFRENGNYAQVADSSALDWPAYLLGIDKTLLESKLTSRLFESKWGTKDESVNVTLNVEQAIYTRDALAKGVYAKLFDYLVQRINAAMFTESRGNNIGILDIYGFEILDKNGFEQLCINFVNEKLQQIFIQLTLKAEQEEYVAENITWTPIDYFNNQVVCELLEGRQPPGVFLVLDDVCATLHAVADGADNDLQKKLNGTASSHKHFSPSADGFVVKHYAGVVSYSVDGFCDRNRDVFFPDLIQLLQSSSCQIIHGLFPEPPTRSRPTTAGNKIRSQAGELVAKLMQCAPHYVRCIKPNETKRPREWDELRVKHQVEYLGLRENISVRRAGFAYRRPFEKFLQRYAILTKESWPMWRGNVRTGVKHILSSAGFKEGNEFQLGLTKVFIKNPESLFHLEELREQQFDKHAKIIQRAFKKHFAQKQQCTQREEAAALFHGKKERRKLSINRHFVGDYLGVSSQQSELQTMIGRREKILFSIPVIKYDRRFKPSARDLVLTSRSLLLINSESQTGSNGNQPVIKRNIPFPNISHVTLSSFQDDFVLLHVNDDYDSLLEVPMKTEFIYVLHKRYVTQTGRHLRILFSNSVEFSVKKTGLGGGGKRNVVFVPTIANLSIPSLKVNGNTLTVGIGAGLPSDVTLPPLRTHSPQKAKKSHPRRAKPKTLNSVPTRPAPTRAAPPPPVQQPPTHSLSPTLPSDALNGSRRVMHSVKQENSPPAQQTGKLPNDLNRATNASPQIKPTRNLLLDNNQDATNCVINNNRPINVFKHELNEKVTVKSPVDFGQELTNTIKRMKAKEKVKPFENSNRTASETISTNSSVLPEKPIPGGKGLNGKVSEKSPVDFGQELTNTIRRMKAKERVKPVESSNRTGSDTISTTNSIVLPEKPIPGGGRPRPTLKPSLIKVKAVYDYQAQDADELSLKEGDFIDLIKEHPGGWWQGRLMGKEGLFPANYVLKV